MPEPGKGIIQKPSNHSVEQTVGKLTNLVQSKGLTVFLLIDHSGEAEKVGIKMPPTKLLIFRSLKGGTPLMLESPTVAIDLPLKIFIREDTQGKVCAVHESGKRLGQGPGTSGLRTRFSGVAAREPQLRRAGCD